MNTETLHVALQQSFSPDGNLRNPAEKMIKELKFISGATSMLLQIASEKKVQFEVRQAAAIHLKNLCRECWIERTSYLGGHGIDSSQQVMLNDEDKNFIRLNLVEALLGEPEKSIQDLMAETLHCISIHDFPDKWPTLLPTLLQTIENHDDPQQALRVHNALLALRKVCKRYEFKAREERGPLNQVVIQSFPLLLPLAQRLSSPNEHSLEAALTLKLILKIFWSSTQFFLPGSTGVTAGIAVPSLSNPQLLKPWFDVLEATLSKPLPEATTGQEPLNQPESVEERNSWPWWKVKKWSVQIMSRLFSRYGIPSYAEQEGKQFADYFTKNVAPQFLGPVCETLNLRPSNQFCTDRVLHLCLTFVDIAIELAPTYKMLKPHLEFLVFQVCFPVLCLSPSDIETFENDPHEFVHRQNSPLADFCDPRMSAITVINNIVKHRGQDVIPKLLVFLNDKFQGYANGSGDHIGKDGSLLIIGSLSTTLFKKKKYVAQIEPLLVTHVFPDFKSPVSFLRCRACWMVQQFSFIKWSDPTHFNTLIPLVLNALSDPALPVQIEASKALRYLIQVEGAHQSLGPVLPQILESYFRIMNEIGNDEVVSALQAIIDQFGDEIEPHATVLISQLSNAYSSYCNAGVDDDDAAMAAAQCLECISTVLKGICERPELYKVIEPQLLPIVKQILGNEGEYIEYLEYALDILTFLTFFPDTISAELWDVFPLVYIAFDQWAFDYLNLMVPPLENFISKNPEKFATGSVVLPQGTISYVDLIFSIVTKTVSEDRASESEVRKALSLYMCILHNCVGRVDNYLPAINDSALAKLAQQADAENPLTRIAVFQIIGSALHYNPQLELAELEKRGVTLQVFSQWMKDSDNMQSWLARKITVLGLCSLFRLPTSSLPPTISSAIPQLITTLTAMTQKMHDEVESAPQDDENADEDANNSVDEDFEGFTEDEDVHSVTDDAYINAFDNFQSHTDIARFLIGDDWADDDFDDDDYVSPLDDIDTLNFFTDTLSAAFEREPMLAQALSPDVAGSYQQLLNIANSKRQT